MGTVKRRDILTVVYLGTGPGQCNVSTPLIWRNLKMVARPIVVRNNFQEGLGHYMDQNAPSNLKGENKRKSSGSLDSNELDIERLKAAQKNEKIVPGQNIII